MHNELGHPTTRLSVPFLLNYSATNTRHPGEVNNVLTALATAESNEGRRDPGIPSLLLEVDRSDLFFEDSWSLFFGSYQDQDRQETVTLPCGLENLDECQQATYRVLEALESVNNNKQCGLNPAGAKEFFKKENIQQFIIAYFDGTVRPRSRIVLKSIFKISSVSTPLLLALLLMGAICGGPKDAKLIAMEYTDLAELLVFEDPSYQRLVYQKRSSRCDFLEMKDIELIQAAILMILIQISSPNAEHRRRVRIHRYNDLVSVARSTGLTQAKNRWHDPSTILNHETFLQNELTIRMMASIAMIDTHFIIFSNAPPVLSPFELGFDLPAEDAGVDICDPLTWEDWASHERKCQRPPPLNQFMWELLSDNWTGIDDPRFQNLNIFTLFIIISKFHPIIFNTRSSLLQTPDQVSRIEKALSRWLDLWEYLYPRLTESEIFRAGFMTHATDLLSFAKILLTTPLTDPDDIAKDSMAHIHELLKQSSSE
ncbi:hypothetical protein PENSTE_c005G04517 [Penicillium steckii]|uniref:Transcription factor domain-containing protein n=1 Tax=Penicillium steckii TaxID=303698 RepID=A0A1V6TM68_9EURO|nr:hypothetical protein PENSTE_c005G04517 [Penicillium steckii]